MLDINTHPLPVCLLLLDNLLGYRGPTTVKPALCLDSIPGPGTLGGASQGLFCLVEVSPSCPAAINSPESIVTSEEAGWTVSGTHLHHALGISQVWASVPDLRPGQRPGLQLNSDHPEPGPPKGIGQGPEPINCHCACKVAGWPWA